MSAVLRLLFLVPLGYILAIAAAAGVVSTAASNAFAADPVTLTVQYLFTMSAIGAAAFAPAAVVIVAAEIFRLRSVFYFLAVGGALGVLLNRVSSGGEFTLAFPERTDLVFPAAGLAAGFVYWLVVGRLSGRFDLAGDLAPVRQNEPDRERAEHAGEQPVDHPPGSG